MSGRIYSGNLNALKDIIERIRNEHDMVIKTHSERFFDCRRNREVVRDIMVVMSRSGTEIDRRAFELGDVDVRCNVQVEWLRRIHSQLNHWK